MNDKALADQYPENTNRTVDEELNEGTDDLDGMSELEMSMMTDLMQKTHRPLSLQRIAPMEIDDLNLKFSLHTVDLNDVELVTSKDYDFTKSGGSRANLLATKLRVKDKELASSQRFWTSMAAIVGVSTNCFKLWSHAEFITKVKEKEALGINGRFNVIEDEKSDKLLAVSNPDKSFMQFEQTIEVLKEYDAHKIRYADGIVTAILSPPNGVPFEVEGEMYDQRLMIDIPIDGYGNPNVYLGAMRAACENDIVAMAKQFKTQVKTGKRDNQLSDVIVRLFESYSNDEGYDALATRLKVATNSILSVEETYKIYQILSRALEHGNTVVTDEARDASDTIRQSFKRLVGDLHSKYGLTSLDQMTARQRSLCKTDARVSDAINFLTELTTHVLTRGREQDTVHMRKINMLIGDMLSHPFHFENCLDKDENHPMLNAGLPDFYFSNDGTNSTNRNWWESKERV